MVFFEEVAQWFSDAVGFLKGYDDSIAALTAGWDSFVELLKRFWDTFTGFFTGLIIK